jgi:citrate lyase subunit beta/citryl-CoA lyase
MTDPSRSLPAPALLFCPGDRPERYPKAIAIADVVVIDLEDAVAPDNKARARQALLEYPVDPRKVIVRVNARGTDHHAADLAAVEQSAYRNVMLAKTESADDARALGQWQVVALCETPLGVLNAAEIAATENVVALMWGAEDLLAAAGGRSSRHPDGRYRDVAVHARSTILLAAKAHGRQAIDAVYVNFRGLDGLALESADAVESGFDLKACIHPSQVSVVVEAYSPDEEQVARARAILTAAASGGVVNLDGQMIDGPLIKQAERTVAWLERKR